MFAPGKDLSRTLDKQSLQIFKISSRYLKLIAISGPVAKIEKFCNF